MSGLGGDGCLTLFFPRKHLLQKLIFGTHWFQEVLTILTSVKLSCSKWTVQIPCYLLTTEWRAWLDRDLATTISSVLLGRLSLHCEAWHKAMFGRNLVESNTQDLTNILVTTLSSFDLQGADDQIIYPSEQNCNAFLVSFTC